MRLQKVDWDDKKSDISVKILLLFFISFVVNDYLYVLFRCSYNGDGMGYKSRLSHYELTLNLL